MVSGFMMNELTVSHFRTPLGVCDALRKVQTEDLLTSDHTSSDGLAMLL